MFIKPFLQLIIHVILCSAERCQAGWILNLPLPLLPWSPRLMVKFHSFRRCQLLIQSCLFDTWRTFSSNIWFHTRGIMPPTRTEESSKGWKPRNYQWTNRHAQKWRLFPSSAEFRLCCKEWSILLDNSLDIDLMDW